MPKKKTGQRKKAERQRERQKVLRAGDSVGVTRRWCNVEMVCDACGRRQKSRAFCYFCQSVQKLPICASCGKTKCLAGTGDCVVRHPGSHATGWQLVGAICDYCEAFVCHSRRCLTTHACSCAIADAQCHECQRGIYEIGGRWFKCASCDCWLCEDDQFEHQASCQRLEAETFKCGSCNRSGIWSCLKCKLCFCDQHADAKWAARNKGGVPNCKRCHTPMNETSNLSISTHAHAYGRNRDGDDDDDDGGGGSGGGFYFGGYGVAGPSFGRGSDGSDDNDDDDDDDDDDDEDDDDGDDDDDDEEESSGEADASDAGGRGGAEKGAADAPTSEHGPAASEQ